MMQQAISAQQLTDKAMRLNSLQRQTVYEFIDFLLNKNHTNGNNAHEASPSSLFGAEEETNPKHILRTVPAKRLTPLVGIIAVGGDAFEESEMLYDE